MIKVSKELLSALDACTEGYREGLRLGVIDGDWGEAIATLEQTGQAEFAQWMRDQRKTRAFIEATGGKLMQKFHVFNTFTGQHEPFPSREEADARYLELAILVIERHGPSIVQALDNGLGDEIWVPADPPKVKVGKV